MVLELILQRLASCQHFPLYGLGLGFEVLFAFRNVLTFSKSINILLFICFALFFDHSVACGTLVSQPGIEPEPSGVKASSLNCWTAKDVPYIGFYIAVGHAYRYEHKIYYHLIHLHEYPVAASRLGNRGLPWWSSG